MKTCKICILVAVVVIVTMVIFLSTKSSTATPVTISSLPMQALVVWRGLDGSVVEIDGDVCYLQITGNLTTMIVHEPDPDRIFRSEFDPRTIDKCLNGG